MREFRNITPEALTIEKLMDYIDMHYKLFHVVPKKIKISGKTFEQLTKHFKVQGKVFNNNCFLLHPEYGFPCQVKIVRSKVPKTYFELMEVV